MYKIILATVLLLTACATPTPVPTFTPTTTNVPTKTAQPTATPGTKEYANKMLPILSKYTTAFLEVAKLSDQGSKEPAVLSDPAWIKKVNTQLDILGEAASEIEAVRPIPAEAKIAHQALLQVAEETRPLIVNFKLGLGGDVNAIYDAAENMQRINSLFGVATEELEKLQP